MDPQTPVRQSTTPVYPDRPMKKARPNRHVPAHAHVDAAPLGHPQTPPVELFPRLGVRQRLNFNMM